MALASLPELAATPVAEVAIGDVLPPLSGEFLNGITVISDGK